MPSEGDTCHNTANIFAIQSLILLFVVASKFSDIKDIYSKIVLVKVQGLVATQVQ